MRRIPVMLLLLLCMLLPAPMMAGRKEKSTELKDLNHIFVGWVAVSPDDYHKQGYSTSTEYANVISGANLEFQKNVHSRLAGLTVTSATDSNDANFAGNDLYIKFSDVAYDHHYRLHLSVHFVDVKTNTEIATVPVKIYTAHLSGLVGGLDKELDQVSKIIQEQLGAPAAEEKH